MQKNEHPGTFVVVEGLDGSGNSTQASRLTSTLREYDPHVYLTKEPTDSLIGGLIRSRLRGEWETSPVGLQLLFSADRAHHLYSEIVPLLEEGAFVICDRYFLSTLAYGAMDMDPDWLLEVNKQFILPDITFFMDVDPEICIERMSEDRHDFELFEKKRELTLVRENYKKLIDLFNDIVVVDGEREIEAVTEAMLAEVRERTDFL